MEFKQYTTTENEDKSVNIQNVEIFKLGKHKGKNFDKAWAEKAIANFKKEKKDGEFPSVIIGHNDGKEEKPAKGFLDNMKVEGDLIIADLTKVTGDTFESLKKREYPKRSVEVNHDNAVFTALALLGGTRPYHKLPIMEFHNDDKHDVIEFAEIDLVTAISLQEKYDGVRRVLNKIQELFNSVRWDRETPDVEKNKSVKSLLSQASTVLNKESKNFNEEKNIMSEFTEKDKQAVIDEQNAKFKETYGKTPEELAKENEQFKENQEKAVADARKKSIFSFAEKLKQDMHIAPAIVDEKVVPFLNIIPAESGTVKFHEDGKEVEKPAMEFFQDMMVSIFEEAAKDEDESKLFVPQGEMEGLEFSDTKGSDTRKKIHDQVHTKATKLFEEGKFESYREAYSSIMNNMAK